MSAAGNKDASIIDPLGYRWTQHWLIQWACGHVATPVADRQPDACAVCGGTAISLATSYPIRVAS